MLMDNDALATSPGDIKSVETPVPWAAISSAETALGSSLRSPRLALPGAPPGIYYSSVLLISILK